MAKQNRTPAAPETPATAQAETPAAAIPAEAPSVVLPESPRPTGGEGQGEGEVAPPQSTATDIVNAHFRQAHAEAKAIIDAQTAATRAAGPTLAPTPAPAKPADGPLNATDAVAAHLAQVQQDSIEERKKTAAIASTRVTPPVIAKSDNPVIEAVNNQFRKTTAPRK